MSNNITNSICLNMIVKDEAHIIEQTLENLSKYIKFDYWVISDTGSTDNTINVIKEFFVKKNIPGDIVEHKWQDFAYNRTKALEAAFNKTDYLLIFDADDSIHNNFELPSTLTEDGYLLKFGPDFVYHRLLIINNRKKWKYCGVLHEYIVPVDNVKQPFIQLEGDYYLESGRSGSRSKDPDKYLKDAIILEKAYFEEKDQGLKNRYAFYCAQSYNNYGKIEEAIKWYEVCLTLNTWNQEKYYSCLMLGDMYKRKNEDINAIKYWLKAIDYDDDRLEGISLAINYFRENNFHILVNLLYHKYKNRITKEFLDKTIKNKLFVAMYHYNNLLEYNNSISACYVNDKETGYDCCKQVLMNKTLSQSMIEITAYNINFYDEFINKDLNLYLLFDRIDDIIYEYSLKDIYLDNNNNIIKLWHKLYEKIKPELIKYNPKKKLKKNKNIKIILTLTSCKRLDLFEKTINSIMNTWQNLDKIDFWFCVDDNSSEIDRNVMKTKYSWINYYMKTEFEKGHRISMNIIWNKIKEINPLYWIHIEDDFLFHKKMDYIGISIDYLNKLKNENIHQILFNKNYAETINNYNIKSHIDYDKNLVIHDYKEGSFNYTNCHYWPHYSFRPSICNAQVILDLGNFDSSNQFFEKDYAEKWTNKGYKSAFFNRITCHHIGKLTSENNKQNAYNLNNVEQFKNNNKYLKIINLERRKDRKEKIISKIEKLNINNYEIIQAIDGYKLEPSDDLYELFLGNDFGSRKGVLGCALSHYNLWKQLLNDNSSDYYIIIEDDALFIEKFKDIIEEFKTNEEFIKKDMIIMGYHMYSNHKENNKDIYYNFDNKVELKPLNFDLYLGGFHCYSINKNGAKKLLDYIENNGIKHGIDYIIKLPKNIEIYETQPFISYLNDWNENGKIIDTDIQNNSEFIDFSEYDKEFDKLKSNFIYESNLDQIGNDLFYKKTSLYKSLKLSSENEDCAGFNTLGFFKNNITELKKSPYFKDHDGIYIKKNFHIKKKIKFLCFWNESNNFSKQWKEYYKNTYNNHKLEIVDNDSQKVDYYVIINYPKDNEYYNPKKTIIFQMEPWVYDENKSWGVKCWGKWAKPDEKDFFHIYKKKNLFVNEFKNIHEEIKINKLNKVISICSSKNFDEGHILRNAFIKYIEKNTSELNLGYQNLTIGFHSNQLCERGTEVALFDYAYYNKLMYNNKSIIFYNKNNPNNVKDVIDKFEREFKCYGYENFSELDEIIIKENINYLYNIKYGNNDGQLVKNCKNLIHSVFSVNEHGDKNAVISEYLNIKNKTNLPCIPHIINLPNNVDNFRYKFNIPEDAIVLGRHGGYNQFDINIAHEAIKIILEEKEDIYFIFVNTKVFYEHPRIIYLDKIINLDEKQKFINTCNAMIHARSDGEIFSLSIGEFSINNKPIITTESKIDNGHIYTLGEKIIKYDTIESLVNIFKNIRDIIKSNDNWNAYEIYTPKNVMNTFYETFINKHIINIYGLANYHNFESYIGQLVDNDRFNGYSKYKYAFTAENNSEIDYATEKIYEPIMCECLCFYWGCPNLEEFIDERAFVRLNLNNFEESLNIIKKAIKEDWWSERIDIIRKEKKRILEELSLFRYIEKITNDEN